MRSSVHLLQGALALCVAITCAAAMTNSWAVQVRIGGKEAADALADKHGFINLGEVGNLKDVYHFLKPVQGFQRRKSIDGQPVQYRLTSKLQLEQNVGYVQQQERRKLYKKEGGYDIPMDPNWGEQWSLLNTGQLNATDVGNDLNVERAWLQGVTGCNTVVAIVDDGVEHSHTDLSTNYVSALQYDFLSRDSDAFPEDFEGVRESHGTNVAGEIGMEKGNGVCGVGVAYNSFITGLLLISDTAGATDMDEAEALSWQGSVVDIYSNSWGPEDDGIVVCGPGDLLNRVLETGVREGRGGKGSIYTFAAGNGGHYDTCAADGYTNSIYTISVGSAASNGAQSSFDERCSGKMVVIFDSDPYNDERAVSTTNVMNSCANDFSGTSASTPLASGVIALLLEANPSLTWRDVQYLIAYTSNRNNLVDGLWVTNGGGLRVSHEFGFGAIDAEAIVSRGRHWISVPAQLSQTIVVNDGRTINIENGANRTLTFTGESTDMVFVEHVVLVFNMQFVGVTDSNIDDYVSLYDSNYEQTIDWPERGRVTVSLTSPAGTTSNLLPRRTADIYPNSYDNWSFMSVHFWGESPAGIWTVNINFDDVFGNIAVAIPKVVIYGTSRIPDAVSRIPDTCSPECDSTRGCAALGAQFCDACANVRIATTRECATSCPEGLALRNSYCYNASQPEATCTAASPTRSGSPLTVQLLSTWSILATITVASILANQF